MASSTTLAKASYRVGRTKASAAAKKRDYIFLHSEENDPLFDAQFSAFPFIFSGRVVFANH